MDRCDFRPGRLKRKKGRPVPSKQARRSRSRSAEKAIALLDINALFKSDPDFSKAMQEIKADETRAEIDMKNAGTKLKADEEEMEKLPAGSPQSAALGNRKLSAARSSCRSTSSRCRKPVHAARIQAYSEYYQKIHGVVDQLCEGPQADGRRQL